MNRDFLIVLMLLSPIFLPAQSKHINHDFVATNIDRNTARYTTNNSIATDRIVPLQEDKSKDKDITQSYLPIFSTKIDLSSNYSVKRLHVKTELLAAKMKSSVQSLYQARENEKPLQYRYRFCSWKISFIPRVMYSFYNRQQLKWYMGVGGSLNALVISKNSIAGQELNETASQEILQKDYLRYNRLYLTPIVRTGIQIHQTVDLSLIFSNRANYTGLSSRHNVGSPTMTFAASYIFHK